MYAEFWWEKLKDQLLDLGTDSKIILKFTLKV